MLVVKVIVLVGDACLLIWRNLDVLVVGENFVRVVWCYWCCASAVAQVVEGKTR